MTDDGRLFDEHIPRLRRYARALTGDRMRADDLVQDCLARAWEKRSLWQRGTDLRAWLFTILQNLYVNDVRRRKSRPELVALDDATTIAPEGGSYSSHSPGSAASRAAVSVVSGPTVTRPWQPSS